MKTVLKSELKPMQCNTHYFIHWNVPYIDFPRSISMSGSSSDVISSFFNIHVLYMYNQNIYWDNKTFIQTLFSLLLLILMLIWADNIDVDLGKSWYFKYLIFDCIFLHCLETCKWKCTKGKEVNNYYFLLFLVLTIISR